MICVRLSIFLFSNMTYTLVQIVSNIALYVGLSILLIAPVTIIVFIIRVIKKKPIKKIICFFVICVIVFFICVVVRQNTLSTINYYDTISEYNVWKRSFL